MVTVPGSDCPECSRRLDGNSCVCGWKSSSAPTDGPKKCDRCPIRDVTVRLMGTAPVSYLCATCRLEVMKINAASDEDVTEDGLTVGECRAKMREFLQANAHKWERVKA